MKLKIVMTMAGLMIASHGYGMEGGFVSHKSPIETTTHEQSQNAQKAIELESLQEQQRAQLSSPLRAISNASKSLGFKERGILVSGKLSLYDQELANIRAAAPDYLNKRNNKEYGLQPISLSGRTTIGTEEYQDADGTRIAVNPVTGTIKWIDPQGHIIKQMSKNLNGTTTVTEITKKRTLAEIMDNKPNIVYADQPIFYRIETTYQTNNLNGARTEKSATYYPNINSKIIDRYAPSLHSNSVAITNFDKNNNKISHMDNVGRIFFNDQPIEKEDPQYRQALKQFLSDQVTGTSGGIINSARSLTLPEGNPSDVNNNDEEV